MFRRRVVGPREVVIAWRSKSGAIIADPAVDLESSDLQAYRDAMFSQEAREKHIKLLPGEQATLWTIKPASRKQKRFAVEARSNEYLFSELWVRFSVLRVGNREEVDDAGDVRHLAIQPDRKDRGGELGECASDDWIEQLKLVDDELTGLACMAQHITDPQVPLSKPSGPRSGADSPTGAESAS